MTNRSERRLVTCLFVDVVGSTDLVGRIGPERMKRLLDSAFTRITELVSGHGGTIEKYVGDAVFALFGAPIAHSDDAPRALRAAMECVLWAQESTGRSLPLAIRVGVETGEALVDLHAVGTEQQRMVVGTCVNIAARLQQQAEPGQVLVGPGCHEATADTAEFEELGVRLVKGVGSIPAWRLGRVADSRQGPWLPFVGRQTELGQLQSAHARARSGQATLALIIGPPGQGKTRLAQEFVAAVSGEAQVLQARCRPGGETGSWTPTKQILAGDAPETSPAGVAARVNGLLDDPRERTRVAKALAHSAGLLVDDSLLSLRPAEREQEIAHAWRRYLHALGAVRPVVLWIEDVHWAEPQLVKLVDRLTLSQSLPLLVLMTGRPEFAGTAVLHPGDDRVFLELGPLDREASADLAHSAAAVDERVIERAEGHPLFIIELARSRLGSRVDLPLTVQAAIAARLDELGPLEQGLLQKASVVGDTFTVRDVALLGEREPAEVAGILARLAHLRHLYATTQQTYRFHHVLVHDVAYARLPIAERMHLHARYAREGVDPQETEALAHHWWEALRLPDADWVWEDAPEREEMRQEALHVHLAAGRRLSDRLDRERALEVYERALKLSRTPLEVATIETAIGLAYVRDGLGNEAWDHRLRAVAAYREAGADPPAAFYADMLEIPTQRWGFFRTLPPEDLVLRLLEEGQQIARKTQDMESLARLLIQHAYFASFDSKPVRAAVSLAETAPDPARFADAINRAATVFLQGGEIDVARTTYERANRLVVAGGRIDELDNLMWRTVLEFAAGNLDRAEQLADRLLEMSATSNAHWRSHARGTKALVLLGRGNWQALEAIARETSELVSANPGVGFCLVGAAAYAYGAAASIFAGRPLSEDLAAFAERCTPDSAVVQASTLVIPYAMADLGEFDARAMEAWRPGQRIWDQQMWDPHQVTLSIALTIRKRWDLLDAPLRKLEGVGKKGGRLCAALAAAIREEMAHAHGAPPPKHATLRDLGYLGVSELVSFRPGQFLEDGPSG